MIDLAFIDPSMAWMGVIIILALLAGAVVGTVVDGIAMRWRPPVKVAAAMGVAAEPPVQAWPASAPFLGWLIPLLTGRFSRTVLMRAVTEIIGMTAFAGLVLADLDPVRGLLRAALIADLLLIFRIDWQHHLIQDRTIMIGLLLAFASSALDSSPGMLAAVLLAGLGAAAVFLFFFILARVLYRQSALGFGDVLLAGLIGAAVGPSAVVGTLFLGMLLAAIGGLIISLARGRNLKTYFAYGTYLASAAIIALAFPGFVSRFPGFF